MIGLMRRAWIGLAGAALVVAASGGLAADLALAQTPDATACVERYMPSPVNENGILCPGEPAIWKSYTYASDGFGYYMEVDVTGRDSYIARIAYVHRDGRVAISHQQCNTFGCETIASNGVPLPGEEDGPR